MAWNPSIYSMANKDLLSLYFKSTPGLDVFGINMILNLAPIGYWWVITTVKQKQVNIDNSGEIFTPVRYDYLVIILVYVYKAIIWRKLYYNKYGLYISTEVWTNDIVQDHLFLYL